MDIKFVPGEAVDVDNAVRFGAYRVAEYRLRTITKWWGSIVAFGLGNPILFLLSVGLGVGSLVDANNGAESLGGVGYLQFVAPALLAAAAIQGVMDEATFPTMDGFVWDKAFFAIGATSVSPKQIANGVMMVALLRGLFTTVLYLGILLAFGAVPLSSVLPLMLTSMFAGWGWAALMLAFTARLENDDGYFAIISRFVVAPMFLFSGTFYPLDQMPFFLQPIGWISPLWHSTELGRFLSYGAEIEPLMFFVHFGYLLAMGLVGMALTYPKFQARLTK
jgi:lipooligosaccharide transport system permease protein